MPPDPKTPPFKDDTQSGSLPLLSPASEPPMLDALPPPLPSKPDHKCGRGGQTFAVILSLGLGIFLADAIVSLLDDSLILLFDLHILTLIRGMLFSSALLVAILIYGLMGLTPVIPKRQFLPLTLFNLVANLAVVPFAIYFYGRIQQVAWGMSLCQVILGLGILYWVQGGLKFRWPLLAANQLEAWRFSWRNLIVFLLVNAFVLLPAVILYLVFGAALALDYFSDGFVALRPVGLTVQVRKYVRNDGKTIQLVPMSHVGESDFYRALSESFPTNSTILMEGVTDHKNLLTNHISYKRMATSLGVAEQHEEFAPRGKLVQADVDVEQFTASTIGFLNAAMLIHAKGLNAWTALELMRHSPPPHFEERLFEDLLGKRNRHLLEEIRARISQSEHITVPWGAAHMPEIAREIQKMGFRLVETQKHVAIRFRSTGHRNGNGRPGKGQDSQGPK